MNKLTRFILAACVGIALCAPPADAAFSFTKLTRLSSGQDAGPQVFSYEDAAVASATLVAANYMANDPQILEAGDLLYVRGSDAVGLYNVTVASTTASTLVALTGTAASLPECIESTVTFDPAATTFGSVEEKDVTATGAVLGDTCLVSAPYDLTNQVSAECYVDTADSVVINLRQPGVRLNGSATWDAASIADGDMESKDITVTGAAVGDPCRVAIGVDTVDLGLVGSVTATNVCTATLINNTGGAVDLASATVTAAVEDVSASAVNLASGTWNARTCTAPTP